MLPSRVQVSQMNDQLQLCMYFDSSADITLHAALCQYTCTTNPAPLLCMPSYSITLKWGVLLLRCDWLIKPHLVGENSYCIIHEAYCGKVRSPNCSRCLQSWLCMTMETSCQETVLAWKATTTERLLQFHNCMEPFHCQWQSAWEAQSERLQELHIAM